jgi:menaquinone-dependent protoporphyrinogen IX oxidase
MKAVVVYESMYGNTHLVADAVADGLRGGGIEVAVVPVGDADAGRVADADLLVVGGPTHVHSLSRPSTRKAAVEAAEKPDSVLEVDPDAEGAGLRDWFDGLAPLTGDAAAFDTRIDASAVLTGRASKGIAKRLRKHGATLVAEPESFLVTKESHLLDDESAHARAWGARLAALKAPAT